jgi:KipI family sensor histidine kinase inhibitor
LYPAAKYLPVGDRALLVEFGRTVSLDINRMVHALDASVSKQGLRGVEECVPTYRSLLIYYNPSETSYEQLIYKLRDLESRLDELGVSMRQRTIEVPVAYGGEYGPDLGCIAEYHTLREEEAVRLHSGREYKVYMIGFIAGFPYLGEVADEIATPRLKTPRLRVPAGSVGIAEKQTGIYPCESPGGWNIIGRTPIKLFDVEKHPPSRLLPGDTVRFKPIGDEEFERIIREQKYEAL